MVNAPVRIVERPREIGHHFVGHRNTNVQTVNAQQNGSIQFSRNVAPSIASQPSHYKQFPSIASSK